MKKAKFSDEKEQKLSAKHLRDYRNNDMDGITQENLGKILNYSGVSIGRFERGEYPIPHDIISKLASRTGWIREYWEGKTECKTSESYMSELENMTEEPEGEIQIREYKEQREKRLKNLFHTCGFGYDDYATITAEHDYIYISDDQESKIIKEKVGKGYHHKIASTQNDGSTKYTFLNDSELSTLLSDISDLIAFRCYQKQLRNE